MFLNFFKMHQKIFLTFLILQFVTVNSAKYFNKESDYYWNEDVKYENLTIKFENFGFRIVCENEIWKPKFEKIKNKLSKCLHLKKIIFDDEIDDEDERKKRDFGLIFGDLNSNYYCRLARHWMKCYKYLEDQHCLEPDTETIIKQRLTKLKEMIIDDFPVNNKLDLYDWQTMDRPYKIMCELAKVQFQASPFGPYGKGLWF